MAAPCRKLALRLNFADRSYQDGLKRECLLVRRNCVSPEAPRRLFKRGREKKCFETVRNISIACASFERTPFLFKNI